MGVWFNWLAELVAPWFIFWPRVARHIAGIIIVLFQIILILSGNLAFLNWLTIVPALACFDDGFLAKLLPRALVRRAEQAANKAEPSKPMVTTAWVVTGIIALLSIKPAANLFSPNQVMNGSFDPFELVNTYGAFGSVGQERTNVVFEGTTDDTTGGKARWKPYVYKYLPTLPDQSPPQIAPYQPHLDWQMWFAAMSTPDQYPWTYNLVYKLLHNDPGALSLFAGNPSRQAAALYPGHVIPLCLCQTRQPAGPLLEQNRDRPMDVRAFMADPRLVRFLQSQGWLK